MKNKLVYLLKFLFFGLIFFILFKAGINGVVYPFSFAMLYALAWTGQKVWIISPAYVIASIASNVSFESIVCALVTILFLLLPYFIHIALKKPMLKLELFAYAFFSQSAFVAFSLVQGDSIVATLLCPVIGLFYLFLSITLFEGIIKRGLSYKLTLPELICAGVILSSVACGLSSCDLYGFSFLKFTVAFGIICLSQVTTSGRVITFASIMGLGSLLNSGNPLYMAPFIIWSLSAIAFKFNNKIFSALALLLSELLVTFYFNLYYSFTVAGFVSVAAPCLLAIMLPKEFYSKLSTLLSAREDRDAVKCLLNRNRDTLQRRLNNLSEVFYDMNLVFKKLIRSQASADEIDEMLYQEIKSTICKNCPEFKHCHRTFSEDTRQIFIRLINISYNRGKITLLDIPSYLASRCKEASHLISEINLLTKQYKSYTALVGNVDTSKLLISDQLQGISGIMKTLAGEVDTMISMDGAREKRLQDELSACNIICTDAVVYEKDARTFMAILVVRDEDVNKLKLQTITSKICGNKMAIFDVKPTEKAGMVSVNLKTAPRFDCVFGLASTPKSGNNISGDRHSIERLDGDKFIFAICDGMGNGEEAGNKAETAVGLIENFYKAGFDSEIVLSSVNKLMNLESDDIFSTIDCCIIDLKDGICDFVKMGAAASYIRGEDGCQIVECSSLPAGVINDAKAVTKKIVLKEKDFIIICSDGINDAFSSDADFKDFLLTIKGQNPQEFADSILQRALEKNSGYAVDDMSVIVVKVF